MPWLVRGDIDGFFGLAIDNLVQLLVIVALCRGVLGFSDTLIMGTILPGVAVSLVVGNVFYAWQAKELSRRTARSDVCALPYGINTVSLFAFIFLVMLPALMAAKARGLGDEEATLAAWRLGLIACFSAGLIEVLAAPFAERLRRATPRAALLSTLGGIALGFISFSFLFRTYANPVVGLATLGVILMVYFGKVRFKGGLPGGFVAVMLGVALSFAMGLIPLSPPVSKTLDLHFPAPVLSDILAGLSWHNFLTYLSVIVPMGIFNVLGSLQNIESAAAAGDPFPTAPSLAMNGVGTIAAALFGSCFPTTLYRSPGLEGAWRARRLFHLERGAVHRAVPDGLAGLRRVAHSDRGWNGDCAVDRHHNGRPILRSDSASSRTGGRHRPASGSWRLGRAHGQGWTSCGPRNVLAGACGENDRERQLYRRWLCA